MTFEAHKKVHESVFLTRLNRLISVINITCLKRRLPAVEPARNARYCQSVASRILADLGKELYTCQNAHPLDFAPLPVGLRLSMIASELPVYAG
jgi:hypothetical protein